MTCILPPTKFNRGDKCYINKSHPHGGKQVLLLDYSSYGPAVFKWVGWLCEDKDGHTFYAREHELSFDKGK